VGWPSAAKPLSEREKFIAMGRIRPARKSPDHAEWREWTAIRRNIWLWKQTNLLLTEAKAAFPGRVSLVRFETLSTAPDRFWGHVCDFLSLLHPAPCAGKKSSKFKNSKIGGYQIGLPDDWAVDEQLALAESRDLIEKKADYDC